MRISDWSSDVCSSDLRLPGTHQVALLEQAGKDQSVYLGTDLRRLISARPARQLGAQRDGLLRDGDKGDLRRTSRGGSLLLRLAASGKDQRQPDGRDTLLHTSPLSVSRLASTRQNAALSELASILSTGLHHLTLAAIVLGVNIPPTS